MKKLIYLLARILHVVSYPFIGLILHNSNRVRTAVLCNGQILLHKSLLGKQRWSLPGGGVAHGERPEEAAARELLEETGITVSAEDLKYIGQRQLPIKKLWPRYNVKFYSVSIPKIVEPHISRPYEVIAVSWFATANLPQQLGESAQVGLDLMKLK